MNTCSCIYFLITKPTGVFFIKFKTICISYLASSLAGNQLSISYKDLLEASTKGKWWVVGSAWQGSETISKAAKQSTYDEPKFTTKLLELARKQRMNTETRRNIFCTILSSEVRVNVIYMNAYNFYDGSDIIWKVYFTLIALRRPSVFHSVKQERVP